MRALYMIMVLSIGLSLVNCRGSQGDSGNVGATGARGESASDCGVDGTLIKLGKACKHNSQTVEYVICIDGKLYPVENQ